MRGSHKFAALGILGVCIFLGFSHLFFGGSKFSSPSISAVVTDAVTGKPVAGATVFVRWTCLKGRSLHGADKMDLHHETLTTDEKGRFTTPAWGPVSVDRGWYIFEFDPVVHITKSGYADATDGNHDQQPADSGNVLLKTPTWQDKGILLKPLPKGDENTGLSF
jgi:5-hydroxyisourate hydrolase-like protein (transthyretin family)